MRCLLLILLLAPVLDARTRAVRSGPIPPPLQPVPIAQPVALVLPVGNAYDAEARVALTNHDTKSISLTLCAVIPATPGQATSCKALTLPAGTSAVVHAGSIIGRPATGILTIATTADTRRLEIRNSLRARPLDALLGPGQPGMLFGPHDTQQQTARLVLYTTDTPARLRLTLRGRYGSIIGEKTEEIAPYTVLDQPLFAQLGTTPQDDTALDITVEHGKHVGAYLRTADTTKIPVLTDTQGTVVLEPGTAVVLGRAALTMRNLSTVQNNNVVLEHYATDQANHPAPRTSYLLLNGETTTEEVSKRFNRDGGALQIIGMSAAGAASATLPGAPGRTMAHLPVLTPKDYARAYTGVASANTLITKSTLFISGLRQDHSTTTMIDLVNTVPGTITARLEARTNDGTLGTATVTLRAHEHHQYDLRTITPNDATGIMLVITPNDSNDSLAPALIAYATVTTGAQVVVYDGFKVEYPKGSGEAYVARWLDLLRSQNFFLNNPETYCMLNGCDGVASIRGTLAALLWKGPTDEWTVAQYDAWLAQVANGITSSSDPELYHHVDPFGWNRRGAIGFTITTSQDTFQAAPGIFTDLTPETTERIYQAIRSFMVAYVDAHQDEYPPSEDPTWRTGNPNPYDLRAAAYVREWYLTDIIWLSNPEARFIIRRFGPDLARELNAMTGSPGIAALEAFLAHLIDGTNAPGNEEFFTQADCFLLNSSRNTVHFYELTSTGGGPIIENITLPAVHAQNIRSIIREGLIVAASAHPAYYGGAPGTGPALAHDPTWRRQDANSNTTFP